MKVIVMTMDVTEVEAMNKRELVAELKKTGLPSTGKFEALKIRLRNHRETVENEEAEENEDDDANDGDRASVSELDNTFVRVNRLEKEVQPKPGEIDALRRNIQSSTIYKAHIRTRTRSSARATNIVGQAARTSESSAMRNIGLAKVSDRERNEGEQAMRQELYR